MGESEGVRGEGVVECVDVDVMSKGKGVDEGAISQ